LLTQQKKWNANGDHGYAERFEEVVRWHIGHSKYGLGF
jgi:hypothetical protein